MPRHRLLASLLFLLAVLGLAACGSGSSSSGDAQQLIKQTFGSASKVRSGNLSVLLDVRPQGLKGLSGPIQVRFAGPFDKPATGNAPRFAFTLSGTLAGHNFSAGATSTGSRGFLTLSGSNYELPAAQFSVFRKSFSSVQSIAQPKTTGSGEIAWLTNPKVEGDEDVSGQATTHVSADVDVGKLLDQLEGRRPAAQKLSENQRQGVIDAVKSPHFDFWTGKDDKILRRVKITFQLEVPKSAQAQLGGLQSAPVVIDYSIAGLNQPQTISVPSNLRPPAELNQRLQKLAQQLSAIGSLLKSGSGGTGSGSGTGGSTQGGASQIQRYQACLTDAAGDQAAVKKCLRILQSSP